MTTKFVIRDLFRLQGVTVLACEGDDDLTVAAGCNAVLMNDNKMRQLISLSGERNMLNQTRPKSFRAFETYEEVDLSTEDARSGTWALFIDS